jgi:hypothetical protein
MRLSDAEILALQPKEKLYKAFLGHGLYIHVSPSGSKYWRLKYRLDGKENIYAIGAFPDVSIAEALEARRIAKHLIREGKNPTDIKRQVAKQAKNLRDKPSSKNLFCLQLSSSGGLTIETESKLLTLTPSQTVALRRFLAAKPASRKEAQQC